MNASAARLNEALMGRIALPRMSTRGSTEPRPEPVDLSGEAADRGAALSVGRRLSGPLDGLTAAARLRGSIPTSIRALVADLVADLSGLREVLDLSVRPEDGQIEDDVAIMAALRSCAERQLQLLGMIRGWCESLDPQTRENVRLFARSELASLFAQSPFFHRVRRRPRGPVWDHSLLGYLFSERLRGPSRFDRYLHGWVFRSGLGRGVRQRERTIRGHLERKLAEGRPLRIASVCAGPCYELVRALEKIDEPMAAVEFVLFDDDAEALVRAVRETQAILQSKSSCREVRVRGTCTPSSSLHASTAGHDSTRLRPGELDGSFDLILCPVLLDDCADDEASALLTGLEARLAPGGGLVAGGLCGADGLDWLLEDALGWRPERRDRHRMVALAERVRRPGTQVQIDAHPDGQSVVLRLDRPSRGRR